MIEKNIMLSTINNVKKFVNIVTKYDFDVDLVSGRYAIDAKSIMGIFSLDLSKAITLKAETDGNAGFEAEISEFEVK